MEKWQCIKRCGACCQLEPDERPDLAHYLTPEELTQYLSLVGEGGWCIHFDHDRRECTIYEQRPRFCRVQEDTFTQMYGIKPEELNDFAIDCCFQQIESVYGCKSEEMTRYNQAITENDG